MTQKSENSSLDENTSIPLKTIGLLIGAGVFLVSGMLSVAMYFQTKFGDIHDNFSITNVHLAKLDDSISGIQTILTDRVSKAEFQGFRKELSSYFELVQAKNPGLILPLFDR